MIRLTLESTQMRRGSSQEVCMWLHWYSPSLFFIEVLGKEVADTIINLYLVLALSYQNASDI